MSKKERFIRHLLQDHYFIVLDYINKKRLAKTLKDYEAVLEEFSFFTNSIVEEFLNIK